MSNLQTWTIDPAHTGVEFAVRHLMIATVKGRFTGVTGTAQLDPDHLATAQASVRIAADTIETGVTDRDQHLRSPDFFDAAAYPALTYQSRQVKRQPDGNFLVIGDLTIRDVTREVPLTVEYSGRVTDPWGGDRVGFTATGKLNRHDFGLDWNAALEAGGVVVGAEVKIALDVELVRQVAQAAA